MLVLKRVDRTKNMARYYVLSVEPTLFAESSLVRRWGRIGGVGRTRIDLHASQPLAQMALNIWLERKRRRVLQGAITAIILAFFVGVLVARTLLRFHFLPAAVLTLSTARFGKVTLNTAFITGNLRKFGEGLVGRLWRGQGRRAEGPPGEVAIFGLVWLSYAVRAVLGAAGQALVARPLLASAAILPFVLLPRRSASADAQ